MQNKCLPVLIAFFLILAFATPSAAYFNPGPAARSTSPELAEIHTVDIESSGFDPWEITIKGGDSITWTNQTTQTVTLEEGLVHDLYLPVIMQTDTILQETTSPTQAPQQTDGVSIPPGESYTLPFPSEGTFYFYLPGHLYRNGVITVRNLPDLEVRSVTLDPNPVAQDTPVTLISGDP